MQTYEGKIGTTGTSEGFRFEKGLFKSNPEFKQRARLRATKLGPGQILVSVVDPDLNEGDQEEDPVMYAFLGFLEKDMIENPQRVSPLDLEALQKAMDLTGNIEISDDDVIPDDVTI